jgi:hypothetical protein
MTQPTRQCNCCTEQQPESTGWLCLDGNRGVRWLCALCLNSLWAIRNPFLVEQIKEEEVMSTEQAENLAAGEEDSKWLPGDDLIEKEGAPY